MTVEKKLIALGLGAGAVAGLVSFGYARVQIAPLVEVAVGLEGEHSRGEHSTAHEHEVEVFSRAVQENIGAAVGTVMFAVIMGALFAVVLTAALCALRHQQITADPRRVAALLAAAAFCAVSAVPFLAYPASPPGVGNDTTVSARTTAYLVAIAGSVIFAVTAMVLATKLRTRIGGWPASVIAVIGYLAAVSALIAVLPSFQETPHHFPADVLADFRLAALTNQALLWFVIGSVFVCVLPRVLHPVNPEESLSAHR